MSVESLYSLDIYRGLLREQEAALGLPDISLNPDDLRALARASGPFVLAGAIGFVASACGDGKPGVGGAESPPPPATQTAVVLEHQPTPTLVPHVEARATATAETKTPTSTPTPEVNRSQEFIETIGLPTGYRPATSAEEREYSSLGSTPTAAGDPYFPDLKKDPSDHLLMPVYPEDSILGSLLSHNPYDPTFLPEPLEGNGGTFESAREVVNGYLLAARKALEEGNIPKAKEWLEKAADKFANTSFDGEGTERYKPQTEEEAENYEYWGKKRGVSRVWLKEYLQVVKAINKL